MTVHLTAGIPSFKDRLRPPTPSASAPATRRLHTPNPAIRRLAWLALVLALPLLLATGCTQKQSSPLRVGLNTWPTIEYFHLAEEKNFYREAGIEVRLVRFSTLSDCRRAFERGQIDVMGCTLVEILQARARSPRSPQVVQVIDYSDGADVILGLPGTDAASALRGARIGVDLASLGGYMLARGLEKYGLGLADVRVVSLDPDSIEAAFRGGELEAAVTSPPTSTRLRRDLHTVTLFDSTEIPGDLVDVIAVDAEVNRSRPTDVARLLRAFYRAQDYARSHPSESVAIMASREGISPEEFSKALTEGIKPVPAAAQSSYLSPGGKLEAIVERTEAVLRKSGQLSGPTRRDDIINPLYVNIATAP